MAERFVVEGGHPLRGSVAVSGPKNAAVAAMAAVLLAADDCYLENLPDIGDVAYMSRILEDLGVEAERLSASSPRPIARRVTPPPPSAVVIGQRPTDAPLAGFAAMGADIRRQGEKFEAEAKGGLRGARIFMDYPSVLGTQNVMLAATLAKGTTVIINAAAEPEIVGLAELLNKMGARVHGAGGHTVGM